MQELQLDTLYDKIQDLKSCHERVGRIRTEDTITQKTALQDMQNVIDYLDQVLIDNDRCPFCNGDIVHNLLLVRYDNGCQTSEVTYKCESCGKDYTS